MAVDRLSMQFYSSLHPRGPHVQGIQFYLGNPGLNNFSDKLSSADFYSDTISEQDTYNRVYDEVLLDPELDSTTRDLLGDFQVVDQSLYPPLQRGTKGDLVLASLANYSRISKLVVEIVGITTRLVYSTKSISSMS